MDGMLCLLCFSDDYTSYKVSAILDEEETAKADWIGTERCQVQNEPGYYRMDMIEQNVDQVSIDKCDIVLCSNKSYSVVAVRL